MLDYRRAYPIAAAVAHALNAQGGKPRKKGKPDYTRTAYRPEEFLSWFARFDPYLEMAGFADQSLGIDEETAKLVVALNTQKPSKLESWMVSVLPLEEIVRAARVD